VGVTVKKYKLELSLAALGFGVALLLYAFLPKKYETAGDFRIAYVDHVQLVEFLEISQFLSTLSKKLDGADVKFFRFEQFKYIVKFQSRSLERLASIEEDFRSIIDQTFKTKYENAIGRMKSELSDLDEQLATLNSSVTDLEKSGARTLNDRYYLLQFKKMRAEIVSRKNLLQSQLGENATQYFDFSVQEGASGKQIFPRLTTLVLFCTLASLVLAYLLKQLWFIRNGEPR
jgi:hypothetical protein